MVAAASDPPVSICGKSKHDFVVAVIGAGKYTVRFLSTFALFSTLSRLDQTDSLKRHTQVPPAFSLHKV